MAAVVVGLIGCTVAVSGCGSGESSSSKALEAGTTVQGENGQRSSDGDGAGGETTTPGLREAEVPERAAPTRKAEQEGGKAQRTPKPDKSRVTELRERLRKAAAREPSEQLGCKRFSIESAQGPLRLIGPPAPRVEARRAQGGVSIGYRFASLPDNETCRPFELSLTVWSGRRSSPTYESYTANVRLRGLSGERVVRYPLAGKPPYRVTVSSTTITGRSGPRVTVPVP